MLRNEPDGTEKRGSGFDNESGRIPVATRRWYPALPYRKRAIARCPTERVQGSCSMRWHYSSCDEARPGPPIPSPPKYQVRPPIPPNGRNRAPEPNVGTLLYLVCLGAVATTIVLVFFGLGFFLLVHPNGELIADPSAGHGGVEVNTRPSDFVPWPDKDAVPSTIQTELPHPATAFAPSVPPQPSEAPEILPSASRDMAGGFLPASSADAVAANATFDASSSQELRGLRSNVDEATLATPAEATHAKGSGIGRHRHYGARKHWAGLSPPGANGRPPPAVNGPEKAWRWIVQSATSILAALSPPPPRQAAGLKSH
jgi:hypothetical protein